MQEAASNSPRATPAESAPGVSGRAVALGCLLLLLIAPVNFAVELLWGLDFGGSGEGGLANFASGCPSIVPVFALFLLASLMMTPALRRAGLRRGELLTIYSMVLVGAPVVSHGVAAWMLVKAIGFHYGALANTHWQTVFIQHVPTWLSPTDARAVQDFFEGGTVVPSGEWYVPFASLLGFALAIFIAMLCVMALLQRQWITYERLSFPIAQIPLEMVQQPIGPHSRQAGALSSTWTFWLGLIIGFGVTLLSSLSALIPSLPRVSLFIFDLIPWQKVGPLAGLGGLTLVLWPWMISLAYLVPKELSFSVWLFTAVRLLLTVAAIAAGAAPLRPESWWDSSFPAPCFQGVGALIALAAWMVWTARRHLARALRVATQRNALSEDSDEPLSYRLSFLGLLISSAFIVSFICHMGARVAVGLGVLFLIICFFTVWARLRAETGLGFLCFPYGLHETVLIPFGSRAFRASEITALLSLRWAFFPGFGNSQEVFTGTALEAFKIADAAGLERRRLVGAVAAGFVISLVFGSALTLTGIYRYGWFSLDVSRGGWLGWMSVGDGNWIVAQVTNPGEPDIRGMLGVLAGGAVTVLLGLMRARFWWWPLHPVGYLASNTWGAQWWALPFLIGWAVKVLVVRYGGLRLYRRSVPLAIGLIVGDLLNGGVWGVITLLTRGRL